MPSDYKQKLADQALEQTIQQIKGNSPIIWHVCISGFLQSQGKMSGILGLWLNTIRPQASQDVFTIYRPWDAKWDEVANLIFLTRQPEREVLVGIYAYSYGGGWGARRLSLELQKRGITVSTCILSDPVYRHPFFPLAWLALTPCPRIHLPQNVDRVIYFLQRNNKPSGHLVTLERNKKKIEAPPMLVANISHQYMDEYYKFHEACKIESQLLTDQNLG